MAGVVVVLVAAVVTVLLVRGGDGEQEAALAAWQADLQAWQSEQVEALTLPDGPALTEVVTGAAMAPIGEVGEVESLDEVNAACTRATAFAEQVLSTPGPPAAPATLEPGAEQSAAFEADLAALTTFQQAVAGPQSTLRQFCGTYALLIIAHTTEDAEEARVLFAQALHSQCPLEELAEECRSLIAGAQGQAGAQPVDLAAVREVIATSLGAAEDELDGAASAFADALTSA